MGAGRMKIETNALDRAIAAVAPGWGLRRLAARQRFLALTGGYTGARRDRRGTQTWTPGGGSADADLLPDLADLRERARDLSRNAPLAAGAIGTAVTNVIGTGLRVIPSIDREILSAVGIGDEAVADRWERDAARVFRLWCAAEECDVTREMSFADIQAMAFRGVLESGDLFLVKRFIERRNGSAGIFGFKLQAIEADRVDNPIGLRDGAWLANGSRIAGGIERDADGAPLAYHVADRHPGDVNPVGAVKFVRVPAFAASGRRAVLHLYRVLRPGQGRGVPYLAPVIESFKELDKYTEAERMAAMVAAMFTVFVKTEAGDDLAPVEPISETGGKSADKDFRLGSGMILSLGKGEAIEVANPARPNQAFEAFVTAIMRQVAAALEMPLELVLKHFDASYSASRAALLEAWKFFRERREWLARGLCQPVYEEVIAEAVARGILSAPGFFDSPVVRAGWLGARWIGPAPGQIDPLKEVQAARERIAIGVSSLADETASLSGGDWEDVHAQRSKEIAARRAAGLEGAVNEDDGSEDMPMIERMPPGDGEESAREEMNE